MERIKKMEKMKKWFSRFAANNKAEGKSQNEKRDTYFQVARSWADDFYTSSIISRNRWRAMSLYVLLPFSFLLLGMVLFLIPIQHLEPLIIHHYDNGLVTVEPANSAQAPKNRAEVESDIVRYVVNRESFSDTSYREQYSLVNLLSGNSVSDEYVKDQSSQNKNSPINTLGDKGYRSVQILSVLFLDKESETAKSHHNLAQVNFVAINHDKATGNTESIPMSAIISWDYRQRSKNPEEAWQNWDGFVVTHYEVQQQSVQRKEAAKLSK